MFNVLLYTLQVLHILWSYMIFRIIVVKFTQGHVSTFNVIFTGQGHDVPCVPYASLKTLGPLRSLGVRNEVGLAPLASEEFSMDPHMRFTCL